MSCTNICRKCLRLSLLFSVGVVFSCNSIAAGCEISKAIDVVSHARTRSEQDRAAENLYRISISTKLKDIDASTIKRITKLLKSTNGTVTYWSALALGSFGAKSKGAIPELTVALHKYECIRVSKSPASGIAIALHKITGKPTEMFINKSCN